MPGHLDTRVRPSNDWASSGSLGRGLAGQQASGQPTPPRRGLSQLRTRGTCHTLS